MASTLSVVERQRLLDNFGTTYGFASAHSADPGATGSANELAVAGSGTKSFEADDELVLALAA